MACARQLIPVAMLGVLLSCGSPPAQDPDPDPGPNPPPGTPTETFTAADGTRFGVQVIATRLDIPWSLAFAPDGRLFFTERPGRVRIMRDGQLLPTPALTLTDVFTEGESGVLGIALHPDFASNRLVYLVYTALARGRPIARLMRYREVNDTLAEGIVLLDEVPAAGIHNGSRVRFGPDRLLYVTFGDVAVPSLAQDVAAINGKILRFNDNGTAAAGNPFLSPVFSYGHRNPQGIDWHPVTQDLWESEHGQTGNDEINVIQIGRNYGWPVIEGGQTRPDMEAPITSFSPAIAPSGASFYTGTAIPAFRNNLFVGMLRGLGILRVRLDAASPRRIAAAERLMENRYGRIRDVVTGPDGALYFCTSNRDGRTTPVADDDRIFKIVPIN
jgi:glucose/arabinose dehydrogenase